VTRRVPAGSAAALPEHPVRVALLDLLTRAGSVTSTEAARELGYSSGLCSFHLRQLARQGLIEDAPTDGGRARPWQLRWGTIGVAEAGAAADAHGDADSDAAADAERAPSVDAAAVRATRERAGSERQARDSRGTGAREGRGCAMSTCEGSAASTSHESVPRERLSRELEDASYQHWQAQRDDAPPEWQEDEAFSVVLHLTPAELAEAAAAVRAVLAGYQRLGADRPGTRPVAAISRMFPLLPADEGGRGDEAGGLADG
jgi:hypothetical protein